MTCLPGCQAIGVASTRAQAHFVLTRYGAAAGGVEKQAAERMLEKLAALARCNRRPTMAAGPENMLIAAAPADRDLADLIAAKLRAHGHRALRRAGDDRRRRRRASSSSAGDRTANAQAVERVVAILERKWNEAGFPLFVVTRHARCGSAGVPERIGHLGGIRAAAGNQSIAATVGVSAPRFATERA